MAKPVLYVPDSVGYFHPFSSRFDLLTGGYKYDVDLLDKADALLLTGGGDIHPNYYGQEDHAAFGVSAYRDKNEAQLIAAAVEAKKPIIGVCRGAEWLAIAGGGALIQDVDNHGVGHEVETVDGKKLYTSSMHHQMCDLRKVTHKMLAWSNKRSKKYIGENGENLFPEGLEQEPEVFWVPKIRGFAVQGHPEAMPSEHPFVVWMLEQLDYYINQ